MQSSAPRIVVVGSANTDLIASVPRFPQPGETLHGTRFLTDFGGKGANQAVAAAKLGASVSFIGAVGSDAFGAATADNFRGVGVDTTHLSRVDAESGVALILVEEGTGRNHITVVAGANYLFGPAEVQNAKSAIEGAALLVGQLEIKMDANLAAFKLAKSSDSKVLTVLNPAPAAEIPDELIQLVDILVPNETELALLTGLPTTTDEEVVTAAKKLLECGVREHVIVTLGDRGALLLPRSSPDEPQFVSAPKVDAIDTSGAGDCFVGALAYLLASEAEIFVAVKKAVAVASVSVARRGTQKSYPSPEEVLQLL